MFRTYSELITLPTFEERFEYLKTNSKVGEDKFGFTRFMNQEFYTSPEWKRLRNSIIIRDNACDLALEGHELNTRIYIHHLNPISKEDLINMTELLTDPENLVCCSFDTHQAIHYGSLDILPKGPIERKAGDTCPWKHI